MWLTGVGSSMYFWSGPCPLCHLIPPLVNITTLTGYLDSNWNKLFFLMVVKYLTSLRVLLLSSGTFMNSYCRSFFLRTWWWVEKFHAKLAKGSMVKLTSWKKGKKKHAYIMYTHIYCVCIYIYIYIYIYTYTHTQSKVWNEFRKKKTVKKIRLTCFDWGLIVLNLKQNMPIFPFFMYIYKKGKISIYIYIYIYTHTRMT